MGGVCQCQNRRQIAAGQVGGGWGVCRSGGLSQLAHTKQNRTGRVARMKRGRRERHANWKLLVIEPWTGHQPSFTHSRSRSLCQSVTHSPTHPVIHSASWRSPPVMGAGTKWAVGWAGGKKRHVFVNRAYLLMQKTRRKDQDISFGERISGEGDVWFTLGENATRY